MSRLKFANHPEGGTIITRNGENAGYISPKHGQGQHRGLHTLYIGGTPQWPPHSSLAAAKSAARQALED